MIEPGIADRRTDEARCSFIAVSSRWGYSKRSTSHNAVAVVCSSSALQRVLISTEAAHVFVSSAAAKSASLHIPSASYNAFAFSCHPSPKAEDLLLSFLYRQELPNGSRLISLLLIFSCPPAASGERCGARGEQVTGCDGHPGPILNRYRFCQASMAPRRAEMFPRYAPILCCQQSARYAVNPAIVAVRECERDNSYL